MASMPRKEPGCRRIPEADRLMQEAWQQFYGTAFWQRRRKQQLNAHPLCKFCAARGVVTRASVADHVEPHKGD